MKTTLKQTINKCAKTIDTKQKRRTKTKAHNKTREKTKQNQIQTNQQKKETKA